MSADCSEPPHRGLQKWKENTTHFDGYRAHRFIASIGLLRAFDVMSSTLRTLIENCLSLLARSVCRKRKRISSRGSMSTRRTTAARLRCKPREPEALRLGISACFRAHVHALYWHECSDRSRQTEFDFREYTDAGEVDCPVAHGHGRVKGPDRNWQPVPHPHIDISKDLGDAKRAPATDPPAPAIPVVSRVEERRRTRNVMQT